MYTDPSGESLIAAVIIGAVIAATTYTLTALLADVPFSVGGLAKATFIGAASAYVTFGIGTAAGNLFDVTSKFSKAAFQALAHGTFQGTMSGIQGGDFFSSFAAGALSSIASSAWSGVGKLADSTVGMIAFGTVAGGTGAALTGGNFWQGAVTGLVVSGLNHAMHKMMQEDPLKKHAGKVKHSLEEWESRYKDMSWNEIATEAGWKEGQPLGPNKEWRYIKAPDGNIMDMRHVVVVGYGYGENAGRMIEHAQNFRASTKGSAYDPQDYYSNKIGAYYYQMRHSGSWASNSFAYDFRRFIVVHYRTLFSTYKP